MKRMLSGIQPTGYLTIANYIGAIKQFIEIQKKYESFIFVADLHSLTVNPNPNHLRKKIRETVGLYLACGLNGKDTYIFNQSENIYHPMLSWALECNSYIGEMNRMTQFKEKSQKHITDGVTTGLFTYPVLMTADILIYDADIVPVGIDQKQHVELARNIAERFNHKYGNTFKIPVPLLPETGAKIMNLQDPTKKMSKTDENPKGNIYLLDELNIARKKIMSAITDSESIVKFDPINKPGISNLITIYSSLTNKSITIIEKEFENANYGVFKNKIADEVEILLKNIQTKYFNIIKDDTIEKVLDKGIERTTQIAKEKAYEVYHKLGVGRY
ncbi:MAG: tryptophan--tRNA ligase [Bacilli bacterium]|nr:tryptophan--tRNA ligase [Bacilli bacterium]MDD4407256.1 tryptophan--tRNA ligase [Bacilli bacterium]